MGCMKPMPKEEELQQMPGRGKLDWRPLLAALKEIRFTGPTEIFMHPTPRGIPILPTAAETTAEILRAKTFLDPIAAAV
jgi:sugar phosphate isomerase/epimerase